MTEALFARLDAAIANSALRDATWDKGPERGVRKSVAVGAYTGEAELEAFIEFLRATHRELPHLLRDVTRRYNGIAIGNRVDDAEPLPVVVPAGELRRRGYRIWLPFEGFAEERWTIHPYVDLPGHYAMILGSIVGAGWVVLAVPESQTNTAMPVCWVPFLHTPQPPIEIASSLEGYLERLADHALILPCVLHRAGVPGWEAWKDR